MRGAARRGQGLNIARQAPTKINGTITKDANPPIAAAVRPLRTRMTKAATAAPPTMKIAAHDAEAASEVTPAKMSAAPL